MKTLLQLNGVGKVVHRNFTIFSFLNTHKQMRNAMKRKSDDKPKTNNILSDLKGEKNREIWIKLNEEENLVKGKSCNSDVYFTNDYEQIKHPLKDAISFHQEYLLDKTMLFFPNSVLKANFILNMKMKKSNKFLQKMNGVVIPAHELSFLPKPKIIAFCTKPEDIDLSLKLGAFQAGEEEIVKKLKQGLLYYDEYDQVVCHTDSASVVSKLKSLLRDKLPTKDNKRIGSDLKTLIETYVNGYEYKSKKNDGIPEEAEVLLPLGEINWPIEKLMENFEVYFKSLVEQSSTSLDGHLISKVKLICPPSDEVFLVSTEELMKTDISEGSKKIKNVENKVS